MRQYPSYNKVILNSEQSNDVLYNNGEFSFKPNLSLFKNTETQAIDVESVNITDATMLKQMGIEQPIKKNKPFPDSVIAYYDFANSTDLGRDVSGNNRHGINVGCTYSTDRTNSLAVAPTTNPVSQSRIELTQHKQTFVGLRNITISFWVKSTSAAGMVPFGFFNRFDNNNDAWSFYTGGTNFIFTLRKPGVGTVNLTTTLPNDGSWHHIVVSTGNNGAFMYYDNTLVASNPTKVSLDHVNITDIIIGAGPPATASAAPLLFGWNGGFADVIIFNEQISADMVAKLYNNDFGYDVYPLIGGYNTIGQANITVGTDDNYTGLTNRVFQLPYNANTPVDGILTTSNISNATNALDHIDETAGTMGYWRNFALSILSTLPARRKILLLPIGKTDSGFASSLPSASSFTKGQQLYATTVDMITKGLNTHPLNTLKAIIWVNGEADANRAERDNYQANLSTFYSNLLTDIPTFTNTTPFIVSGIVASTAGAGAITTINNLTSSFASTRLNMQYVNLTDLTSGLVNTYGLSSASLRDFGVRIAWGVQYASARIENMDINQFCNVHIRELPQITSYSSKTKGNGDIVCTIKDGKFYNDIKNNNVAMPLHSSINFINQPWTVYFTDANLSKINVSNGTFQIVLRVFNTDD